MVSLSGPNSRRRLGTQSGAMRREARRLGGRAGDQLQLAASGQKLQEGSAISSSEATIAERNFAMRRDRALARQQRDSLTKPEAGDSPAPTTGGPAAPRTLTQPAPAATSLRAAPSYDSDNNGIPNSIQRPAPTPTSAPAREGRINGMPASQAIAGVEKPAMFGSEYATRNIEKLGLSGAIADYRRRSAEEGKPAEPGNLDELKRRDFVGPPNSPLQTALNESRTRREGYAADAEAAGEITAGLNAAPTPKLDTSFPASQFKGSIFDRQKAREDAAAMLAEKRATAGPPQPSLSYRVGRGVYDTLSNDAADAHGRKIKRGLGKAGTALTDAKDAVGTAIGEGGLRLGRKLKRGVSDLGRGLSGR